MNNVQWLICHHAGGSDLNPLQDSSNYTFDQCNQDHKVRFNFISSLGYYVGYQYFIDKQGIIKQSRADSEEGAHTIGLNTSSLGICLAGNFDATLPTDAQIATLKKWINDKAKQYNIAKDHIVPHRHFAVKTCYGNKLPDDWASNLLNKSDNTQKVADLLKQALQLLQ